MRNSLRIGLFAAAAGIAGMLVAVPASATSTTSDTRAHSAAQAAQKAGGLAHISYRYTTSVTYGNPITFTYTLTGTDNYTRGRSAIAVAKIATESVDSIQFTQYVPSPRNCGKYIETDDDGNDWWVIYCIQFRPERYSRFGFQFRVWPTDIYSNLTTYQYFDDVKVTGNIRNYVARASNNYYGKSNTRIYFE
ncbi:hypothetical protein J5X84_42060 [Streptosporangiaceae bacterium NEAU-GS5]|nr:hypothetical protein [Streptosporangiaceae bacterium NEAU-GS5]